LKQWAALRAHTDPPHQEQVPRKQGLKHIFKQLGVCHEPSSRASSTKTRIETGQREPVHHWHRYHQEQVPRKQGLKHVVEHRGWRPNCHQEQVPRKQGLKPPEVPFFHQEDLPIKSKFHENKD